MSSEYRPPRREPKGAWARHIHAYRKAQNWSASHAFEKWHEGLNLSPRSRSAYLPIDMGDRQPTPEEAAYLVSIMGEPSDTAPEPVGATEPVDPLVQALRDQTAAINALVKALRPARDLDVRLAALEGTVAFLAPTSGGGSQEHELPLAEERSGR